MKKILTIIILFLLLFIGFLGINHITFKNKIKKEHYFETIEIKKNKTDDETDVNDKKKYSDKIILEPQYMYQYDFYHEKESITGFVYIAENDYLYIEDTNNKKNKRISNVKFKTMYTLDYEYEDGIYLYLISMDNKVYIMSLESNNIDDVYIYDYRYDTKFTNFVNLEMKHDMYKPGNNLFVLNDEGRIYDINTGLRYDENTVSLYNKLYVYSDKTMTSTNGLLVSDKKGNNYKLKYIFQIYNNDGTLNNEQPIIVITEDNRYIYFDLDVAYVHEFDKKVKEIKFDQYYPYLNGNLEITFEDDYKVEFTAQCNEYYCINKFAE